MKDMFRLFVNNCVAKVLLAFLFVICHSSLSHAEAQTLYEQNMESARLFLESGCLNKAKEHYLIALELAEVNGEGSIIEAQMGLVNTMKFWDPVEAQRWANRCEQGGRRNAVTHLHWLLMNACISFTLGNTSLFETHYQNYNRLLDASDSLPAKGFRAMEAMNQAMKLYFDEAIRQLDQEDSISVLDRLNITARIYQMSGDTTRLLAIMQRHAEAVDSLTAVLYDSTMHNAVEAAVMTRAQQEAEAESSRHHTIILLLTALVIFLLAVLIRQRQKYQKELKKNSKQLGEALKMANETDEMKTEFVRRVSHEIRTPLNAISGFNDVLNNSNLELSAEERSDIMKRIKENMDAITTIVNEMLQVAATETEVKYEMEDRVLCNKFFSEILHSHEKDTNPNVSLLFTTRVVNRAKVTINADAVTDILDNLINNAIKFTIEGTIELFCHKERGMLHITLTDTGIGIPADKQEEVFKQFTKVDDYKQGIGLGLTVSRNIARKMGGDLVLDSRYTNGARFILTLPL